jgi:hypothetical protein
LLENDAEWDLFAHADPENLASTRVLEKAGFKKGKLWENKYIRAVNRESRNKSSHQVFYLERPRDKMKGKERTKDPVKERQKGQNGEEDAATVALRDSVKSMLGFGFKEPDPDILRQHYERLEKKHNS